MRDHRGVDVVRGLDLLGQLMSPAGRIALVRHVCNPSPTLQLLGIHVQPLAAGDVHEGAERVENVRVSPVRDGPVKEAVQPVQLGIGSVDPPGWLSPEESPLLV